MQDNILLWLKMVLVFGIGNNRLWETSANYDSIQEFYTAVKNHETDKLNYSEYQRADNISDDEVKEILELCDSKGIKYYSYESEGYPVALRRIANPPAVLFCKGNLDFLNDKYAVAVVGSRNPSAYSVEVINKLCKDLLQKGFILLSGFAQGVDQRVNILCLDSGKTPVAVCARDIESDYPKGSMELKKLIAEKGAVVSEYYPGSRPAADAFVKRNRISVGLSCGALFIEARRDSKGLDNYNHAIYQGKPVFVVPPHDIFDKRYMGQANLLRDGCTPVFSSDDIIHEIIGGGVWDKGGSIDLDEYFIPSEDSFWFNHGGEKKKRKRKVKQTDDENIKPVKKAELSALSDEQQLVVKLLEKKDMLIDELAVETGLEVCDILVTLTELELNGIVRSLPGKMYGI